MGEGLRSISSILELSLLKARTLDLCSDLASSRSSVIGWKLQVTCWARWLPQQWAVLQKGKAAVCCEQAALPAAAGGCTVLPRGAGQRPSAGFLQSAHKKCRMLSSKHICLLKMKPAFALTCIQKLKSVNGWRKGYKCSQASIRKH